MIGNAVATTAIAVARQRAANRGRRVPAVAWGLRSETVMRHEPLEQPQFEEAIPAMDPISTGMATGSGANDERGLPRTTGVLARRSPYCLRHNHCAHNRHAAYLAEHSWFAPTPSCDSTARTRQCMGHESRRAVHNRQFDSRNLLAASHPQDRSDAGPHGDPLPGGRRRR